MSNRPEALPVKTSKPSFLTFFVYFGNSLFDYLWNFLFVAATNRKAIFLLNYASWASLARKNWRWISKRTYRDWAANQSARKTLSTVLVYTEKKKTKGITGSYSPRTLISYFPEVHAPDSRIMSMLSRCFSPYNLQNALPLNRGNWYLGFRHIQQEMVW